MVHGRRCGGRRCMWVAVQAWLHLRRYHDLEVTLYVLAPQFSSLRERERRREMLAERTHMMLAGLEEGDLPEGMSLDEIRRPVSEEPPPLEERVMWAVPHALALRRSVAEVVEACELLALTETTAPHSRPPGAADGWQLREQMTWEMGVAGLHGAGTMFEGLGAPRSAAMDFEAFAFHAQVPSGFSFAFVLPCWNIGSVKLIMALTIAGGALRVLCRRHACKPLCRISRARPTPGGLTTWEGHGAGATPAMHPAWKLGASDGPCVWFQQQES